MTCAVRRDVTHPGSRRLRRGYGEITVPRDHVPPSLNVPVLNVPSLNVSASLTRFAWLSIGAAVTTMGMKAVAALLTGSVGLLSDAMESGVNLVAAVVALVVLRAVEKEPDDDYAYGRAKA